MWNIGWRDRIWSEIKQPWDIIVIGGGITGAGILREATRLGLKTLLVEGNDFASGTSSRSSKLVHGGFRYLKNAQLRLTYYAVRERERLLKEGRGLINPLSFLMTSFPSDPFPAWVMGLGLTVYDLLAFRWGHQYHNAKGLRELCPQLSNPSLLGGHRYIDALTDDSRLVLRLIREAVRNGGSAINYTKVYGLLFNHDDAVCGIRIRDVSNEMNVHEAEVEAKLVINATGAWSDEIRNIAYGGFLAPKHRLLRKLRGSHIIFPHKKIPINRAISAFHPYDSRPVFAFPWQGVSIIGTTDVDHKLSLQIDPRISEEEIDYLVSVATMLFPDLDLNKSDIQSTYSGVRAVLDTGKTDPSKESREHMIWQEKGMLTVTGGKLTTFRLMAKDALFSARKLLSIKIPSITSHRMLDLPPSDVIWDSIVDPSIRLALLARYGKDSLQLIANAEPEELSYIENTQTLWAELRWAAQAEGVVHLDDLLLRRVRIGLTLPKGAIGFLDQIRSIVQSELKWDDIRWKQECDAYINLWNKSYGLAS
jgi:glycerol-3-phosphate dehydrogenase